MNKEPNATNAFLNRLAALYELRSDYAIAAFLGVSRQHVSHWRREKVQFSDDQAVLVAERLDIPPIEIIAAIGAQRAREEKTRNAWRRTLEQFKAAHVVPVFFAAILAAMTFTHVGNDAPQAFESVGAPAPTGHLLTSTYEYYVKPHPLERVAAGAASWPAVPVAVLVLLMALATGRRRRL